MKQYEPGYVIIDTEMIGFDENPVATGGAIPKRRKKPIDPILLIPHNIRIPKNKRYALRRLHHGKQFRMTLKVMSIDVMHIRKHIGHTNIQLVSHMTQCTFVAIHFPQMKFTHIKYILISHTFLLFKYFQHKFLKIVLRT